MKKFLILVLIVGAMFASQLNASEINYEDWSWNGVEWVYTGSDDDPDLPPPPPVPIRA